MKLLIAPDKLKGTLSARAAARAIAAGARRARPDVGLDLCPLADGGEGTLDALLEARGGERRSTTVTGPRGRPVRADWALLADGHTAVIESAAAVGLGLLGLEERDPTRTTSFGAGELVRAALDAGARSVLVGLGGSATCDGGAGLAQALGVRFEGAPEPISGGDLERVRAIDRSGIDPRLAPIEIVALADVDSPLLGAEGAARVYAPQKGASADQVRALERGLAQLAELAPHADATLAGTGAAGGLGFGLCAFAHATLASGAERVLDAVGFDERLAGVDHVITGEGRLDAQSLRGKLVIAVARRAQRRGVNAIALCGAVGDGVEQARREGLNAWFSLADRFGTERAMRDAESLLAELAAEVVAQL